MPRSEEFRRVSSEELRRITSDRLRRADAGDLRDDAADGPEKLCESPGDPGCSDIVKPGCR